ncbi:MAG: hypothetical protein SFU56_07185 [Capsulimonadales bacterium]|nr:hypothetical protein [Capsulimonadales bacterium]
MSVPEFLAVYPISGETEALPVNALGPAIGYYVHVLGFSLIARDDTTATLRRDQVTIGLALSEQDPEAVSCYFSVRNIEALRDEYVRKGIDPTEIRLDTHNGKNFRVFFAKEPYGVCFCFGEPA